MEGKWGGFESKWGWREDDVKKTERVEEEEGEKEMKMEEYRWGEEKDWFPSVCADMISLPDVGKKHLKALLATRKASEPR